MLLYPVAGDPHAQDKRQSIAVVPIPTFSELGQIATAYDDGIFWKMNVGHALRHQPHRKGEDDYAGRNLVVWIDSERDPLT